jgi:hypothetical protein
MPSPDRDMAKNGSLLSCCLPMMVDVTFDLPPANDPYLPTVKLLLFPALRENEVVIPALFGGVRDESLL